jgi:hypothetical protein
VEDMRALDKYCVVILDRFTGEEVYTLLVENGEYKPEEKAIHDKYIYGSDPTRYKRIIRDVGFSGIKAFFVDEVE